MKKKKVAVFILVCFVISVAIGSGVWALLKVENIFALFIEKPYLTVAVTTISLFASLIAAAYESHKDQEEAKLYYETLRNSMLSEILHGKKPQESKEETTKDILELMLANMKEIKDYYVLSKAQARNAFILAVAMCILGFLLMGVSITAAFLNSENLASTIVPAIGAAIVEIIAGTSLVVYKQSLNQLNHYYDSLHNNERFLSIVNLVSKVSKEKQDDIYIAIIQSQIEVIAKDDIDKKE